MAETESSWIQRAADDVIKHARAAHDGGTIVCETGISPSGPIHLGNLREIMTVHFVAEELKARGYDAVHIHSWDDYDRFRKVPAGLDPSLAEHIGRPVAAVPDPCGGAHDSYASHFLAEFTGALAVLGVGMREIRQSEEYPRGAYNSSIRFVMDRRTEVFDILASFQTEGRQSEPIEERRAAYYPFKPYCETCGKDSTTVTGWGGLVASYRCANGHTGEISIGDGERISGKLVWKVDWPMRWVHEQVDFEPAGADHHAPTSGIASGGVITREIFNETPPLSFPYSFVGMSGGSSKMSSSAGGAAIPATALDVLEPAMLRWLYARRTPAQGFTIDMSPKGVQKLYDEWDQFVNRASAPDAAAYEAHLLRTCLETSLGPVRHSRRPVSFRLLASAADLTQANVDQLERLVRQHLGDDAPYGAELHEELEPRLTCAINFATRLVPSEERTTIRTSFATDAWEALDEPTRKGVRMLDERLDDHWNLEDLTRLVYAVPKLLMGLGEDAPPSAELKKAQRSFFAALYRLLCSSDTGPRLPTLLLSIGPERAHQLLAAGH